MKPPVQIPKSRSETRPAEEPTLQLEDKIRKRAYELYEQRGRIDGNEVDDWLRAESEIVQNTQAA
jgi:hypothetical protein